MGDTAYIYAAENCDFCKMEGLEVEAKFDGKTIHGPWAYMCNEHFGAMGIGLGTGRGQRLIVGERPKRVTSEEGDEDMEDIPPMVGETPIQEEPERASDEQPEAEATQPEKETEEKLTPPKMDWGNLHP